MRPEGLEPPTFWSVARRSIQLSYGRIHTIMPTTGLEPVRHFWHWSLKPACLPIPARGRGTTWVRPSDNGTVRARNARGGTRTLTGLPPQDPESCASTNSATRALPSHHDGAEGNRTPDLLNAIQALSQLSYGPLTRPAKPSPSRASTDFDLSINRLHPANCDQRG
jgi:hypothetical protein